MLDYSDVLSCTLCYSTIRIWKSSKQSEVINAHKPAVWAIASLFEFDGTKRMVSGMCRSIYDHINMHVVCTCTCTFICLCLCAYIHTNTNAQTLTHTHTYTGGADRVIRLWEVDSKICVQEYHGHADVVRDVKVVSGDMFLSSANDW